MRPSHSWSNKLKEKEKKHEPSKSSKKYRTTTTLRNQMIVKNHAASTPQHPGAGALTIPNLGKQTQDRPIRLDNIWPTNLHPNDRRHQNTLVNQICHLDVRFAPHANHLLTFTHSSVDPPNLRTRCQMCTHTPPNTPKALF